MQIFQERLDSFSRTRNQNGFFLGNNFLVVDPDSGKSSIILFMTEACNIYSLEDGFADDLEEITGEDYYDTLQAADNLFSDNGVRPPSNEELFEGCFTNDGRIVGATTKGFIGLEDQDKGEGRMRVSFCIAVVSEVRRQGVARALIESLLAEYPENEYAVEAHVINPHMVPLLESLGFETVGSSWSLNSPHWSLNSPHMFKTNPGEPPEIALMTKDEFLELRNPQNKFHEDSAYDVSLEDLNRNYRLVFIEESRTYRSESFYIYKSDNDFLINYSANGDPKRLAALIHEGVLYYSDPTVKSKLPTGYLDRQKQWTRFEITDTKRVKYLHQYLDLVNKTGQRNLSKFTNLYQRIIIQEEPFQIVFEVAPVLNAGTAVAILNAANQVVAMASNEWGATLLQVASEYRGKGLGKLLGQVWYRWNPEYPSGGFTSAGRANAIAIWEDQVREFLASGRYSQMIKQKLVTKERVREIVSGLSVKNRPVATFKKKEDKKLLVFIEKEQGYWGPAFIIYNEAFYNDQDSKYIYAFGFFRDSDHIDGSFLYRLDYNKDFSKVATYIALQIARNNQEKVYIGQGYGDMLELDGLEDIELQEDYVELTQDVLNLELLRKAEVKFRKAHDSYDEIYKTLLEVAHGKEYGFRRN